MPNHTDEFKIIQDEELATRELIDEDYDLVFGECKCILENVKVPFELLSLAFTLGYSRALKAGANHG